jgi:hypothetical protein
MERGIFLRLSGKPEEDYCRETLAGVLFRSFSMVGLQITEGK